MSIEDCAGDGHCEKERHQKSKQGEQGTPSQLHTDAVDVEEDSKSNQVEVEAYLPADDRHIAVYFCGLLVERVDQVSKTTC